MIIDEVKLVHRELFKSFRGGTCERYIFQVVKSNEPLRCGMTFAIVEAIAPTKRRSQWHAWHSAGCEKRL